ncbi:MAG: hypothetical protein EBY32_05075 [Proteobacteria bacterium]|nr:hypothetical protein [Pseudomonadota bacterium]
MGLQCGDPLRAGEFASLVGVEDARGTPRHGPGLLHGSPVKRGVQRVRELPGEVRPRVQFLQFTRSPAFDKFPVLQLYKEFLRENGALMSGSGSTTFAIAENISAAETLAEKFKPQFGDNGWTATVAVK